MTTAADQSQRTASNPNQQLSTNESADLPALAGSNALMAFLQSELQQLESVAGVEDEEARNLLQQLEQQTAVLQSMSRGQQPLVMTELQLAEQLDSLDLQLSQLEASLAVADAPTLELLGQSTSRWMHAAHTTAAGEADVPVPGPSEDHSAAGTTDRGIAARTDAGPVTDNTSPASIDGCTGLSTTAAGAAQAVLSKIQQADVP